MRLLKIIYMNIIDIYFLLYNKKGFFFCFFSRYVIYNELLNNMAVINTTINQ